VINSHLLPQPLWGRPGRVAEYRAELDAASRLGAGRPGPATPAATLAVLTDPESLAKGQAIYEGPNLCHACHRKDLGGMVGPNLADNLWIHGCSPADLVNSVASGFPPLGMLPYGSGQKLTDEQLLQVVSYVLSRQGSNPASPRAANPAREKACG
jgi:cytochrome c oxidase cbb3-type subunit 3